jgi:hypothetical protein
MVGKVLIKKLIEEKLAIVQSTCLPACLLADRQAGRSEKRM